MDMISENHRGLFWWLISTCVHQIFDSDDFDIVYNYKKSVESGPIEEQILVFHEDPLNVAADLLEIEHISQKQFKAYDDFVVWSKSQLKNDKSGSEINLGNFNSVTGNLEQVIPSEDIGQFVSIFSANKELPLKKLALALANGVKEYGHQAIILTEFSEEIFQMISSDSGETYTEVQIDKLNSIDLETLDDNASTIYVCNTKSIALEDIPFKYSFLKKKFHWVFACHSDGCTPSHIKLLSNSDSSLLLYSTISDEFMRAYWFLEAVSRKGISLGNTLLIACGSDDMEHDQLTQHQLNDTLEEFLDNPAPPTIVTLQNKVIRNDQVQTIILAMLSLNISYDIAA